jgi:H+/Cl- antiporter ClcA
MGALGYAYLKAISETTDAWIRAGAGQGYPSDPATLQFGAGSPWWVGLCGGAGVAVGLARAALRLERAPTFIEELRTMHSDVPVGLKAGAVTLLGLLGGVPMGPEAGLGAVSAAAGQLLASRLRAFRLQAEQRRRVYVLSAMCSVFAALMPSPLVAILLVLELGRPLETLALPYMHVMLLLAFGATASFAVYFGIAGCVPRRWSSSSSSRGRHECHGLVPIDVLLQ